MKTNSYLYYIVSLVAVAVIAIIGTLFLTAMGSRTLAGANCNGGNCTDFDAVNTSDGYYVDDSAIVDGSGNIIGYLKADAGIRSSYANATTTGPTSLTLIEADILDYGVLLITPDTGATTLTLPATSTVTSYIPAAGDMAKQCWYNATGTAAATITVAAGTGWDLERAATSTTSGSTGVLAIPAGGAACFTFIRQTDTDISALMIPFIDAD